MDALFESVKEVMKFTLESQGATTLTRTVLPYKCEVKYCFKTLQPNAKIPKGGIPNLILHANGLNWRVRSELLLMKEGNVFALRKNKIDQYGNSYKIPGGGIDDPNEFIEEACARECEEEALIVPKNVYYTGIEIQNIYLPGKTPWWHSEVLWPYDIKYDGSISFVCVGEYKKKNTKYVKLYDRDETKNGKFYSYEEAKEWLSEYHKKAIEDYLNKKIS